MADSKAGVGDGPRTLGNECTVCAYAGTFRNTVSDSVASVACLIVVPGRDALGEKDFHALGDRRALDKLRDPEIAGKLAGNDWVVVSRHVEYNTIFGTFTE